MEKLYVLYDARCGLCGWAKRWLMQQPAIVPLSFIPAGSVLAGRLFPGLYQPGDLAEGLVVVSDEGGVYREGNAWIMCLFALEEYRDWANRLAHPLLRPLARQGFALLSGQRSRISRWLSLASENEIAETLRRGSVPACAPYHDGALKSALPITGGDGDLRSPRQDPKP
ncbi:MAG: DCC1-like thiol-disulfide oxidoreductase family protein [Isosphaeraceae bacterium]|jgi:predicted DCC family thiol-disulfide oxidoreductase YuxK